MVISYELYNVLNHQQLIHLSHVNSPCKELVVQKVFPCQVLAWKWLIVVLFFPEPPRTQICRLRNVSSCSVEPRRSSGRSTYRNRTSPGRRSHAGNILSYQTNYGLCCRHAFKGKSINQHWSKVMVQHSKHVPRSRVAHFRDACMHHQASLAFQKKHF